jgi:hypothetical protein
MGSVAVRRGDVWQRTLENNLGEWNFFEKKLKKVVDNYFVVT